MKSSRRELARARGSLGVLLALWATSGCAANRDSAAANTGQQAQQIEYAWQVLLGPNSAQPRFRLSEGWFHTGIHRRVFAANVAGDEGTDIVGIDDGGGVWVATAQGNTYSAPTYRGWVSISPNNGYFYTGHNERVFFANVDGGSASRDELVAVDYAGTVHVVHFDATGVPGAETLHATNQYPTAPFFDGSTRPHFFVADVNNDGLADFIGLGDNGTARVTTFVSGSAATSTFLASSWLSNANGWFVTSSRPRVWVEDVTGDGRADLVGIDNAGNILVYQSTGTSFSSSPTSTATPFSTPDTSNNSYFTSTRQSRIFFGDIDGNGSKEVIGIAPEPRGDGDVWALSWNGSGFDRRVVLHESIFQSGRDWFSTSYHPRVFMRDVNNDNRADLVGVAINGDMWVGESATESAVRAAAGDTSSRTRLGPTILARYSNPNNEFATTAHPRMFWGRTGPQGPQDMISIRDDGAILRIAPAPTRVVSVTPVQRSMLSQPWRSPLTVTFSNPMVAPTPGGVLQFPCVSGDVVHAGAPIQMRFRSNGLQDNPVPLCGFQWDSTGKSVTFQASLLSFDAIEMVEMNLPSNILDARGLTIDHDGDGQDLGTMTRRWIFSNSIVVGTGSRSIVPGFGGAPAYAKVFDVPGSSGYHNMRWQSPVDGVEGPMRNPANNIYPYPQSGVDFNVPKVRAIVIAGGGTPSVATEDGSSVLLSFDLVGFNATRLARRIEAKFGIPAHRVIATATHAHAAPRQIRLFHAPLFDDRHAVTTTSRPTSGDISDPYAEWLERQALAAVGHALGRVYPVSLRVRRTGYDASRSLNESIAKNRARSHDSFYTDSASTQHIGDINPLQSIEFVYTSGGVEQKRAMLVNFALHPVSVNPWINAFAGTNADFPGYLASRLERFERSNCQVADDCVAMFVNASAGNIVPANSIPSQIAGARAIASSLEAALEAATPTDSSLSNALVSVARSFVAGAGVSNCVPAYDCQGAANCNADEPRPSTVASLGTQANRWELPVFGFRIRSGATDLLRVGTMPGESFLELQGGIVSSTNAVPTMVFGYTHDYDGYFPSGSYLSETHHSYARVQCDGPTFFPMASVTTGDQLRSALLAGSVGTRVLDGR